MGNTNSSTPWALLPFGVFAAFYVSLSLAAGDFYRVPMPIAFLVASATALAFGPMRRLGARIETYAAGMGETNIMIMCLIFVLSGAFAAVAKGTGAVEAAVTVATALVPARLMLAGTFLISCLISLALGTSCGTIAAVTPIALGFAESLQISPALLVGAVVGGSMFGDNLSLISDTTIAATRTQGIALRDKFFANLRIALPAAFITLAFYACLGDVSHTELAPTALRLHHLYLVSPYLLIFALALLGANVIVLLFFGTLLTAALGICLAGIDFWQALDFLGKGAVGMSETLIVALLAGGLFRTIQANGGVSWLTDRIARLVRGPRSCEFGVFLLTALTNLFTANNTVAIVIVGPLARTCSERFHANPKRIASILDTASCIVQGMIPYGAQILIALGVAQTLDITLASTDLVLNLFYPPFLALSTLFMLARR